LTVDELNRIDRIPGLVFSNACESGITPQQREQRSALLAPSFAEAFFARGVRNFICTAWPVDDAAALAFSQRVYTGILGLRSPAESLHLAMAAARADIARMGLGGMQTWGAYQHYGDPYFHVECAPVAVAPPGVMRKPGRPEKGKHRRRKEKR